MRMNWTRNRMLPIGAERGRNRVEGLGETQEKISGLSSIWGISEAKSRVTGTGRPVEVSRRCG